MRPRTVYCCNTILGEGEERSECFLTQSCTDLEVAPHVPQDECNDRCTNAADRAYFCDAEEGACVALPLSGNVDGGRTPFPAQNQEFCDVLCGLGLVR